MSSSGWPTPSYIVVTKRFEDSPYNVNPSDGMILTDCSSGQVVLNMASAVGLWGDRKTIKKIDFSNNPVSIIPLSGQTIDSFTEFTIRSPNSSRTLASDNFNWWVE